VHDTLVLDMYWQPQHTCSWMEAVKLVWEGRAQVIKEDEGGRVLRSPSMTMGMPRVIVVKNAWVRRKRVAVPCTRRNIAIRDESRCQYCGYILQTSEYTLDHVIPRSQGGTTTWKNTVLACAECNHDKDGRTPAQAGMALRKTPVEPKVNDPRFNFKLRLGKKFRPEWTEYMRWKDAENGAWSYWNIALEP
jgi:5-methylcytosine-specific restriction endonuclease McrA